MPDEGERHLRPLPEPEVHEAQLRELMTDALTQFRDAYHNLSSVVDTVYLSGLTPDDSPKLAYDYERAKRAVQLIKDGRIFS